MTDSRFKRIVIGLFLMAVLLFALADRLHYRVRSTYACPDCLSEEHVYQWRYGLWPDWSLPLTGKKVVLAQSFTLTDFLTNAHQHRWEFMQESPYYLFGTKW